MMNDQRREVEIRKIRDASRENLEQHMHVSVGEGLIMATSILVLVVMAMIGVGSIIGVPDSCFDVRQTETR
jgi:hypothetical protein